MARPQRKTNWTIITYAGLLGVLVAIGGLISKHVPDAYMVQYVCLYTGSLMLDFGHNESF